MEVANKLGKSDLTFSEFVAELQSDPEERFSTGEELLDYARDIVKNKIEPKMKDVVPEEFLTEQLYSLDVAAVPPNVGGIAYYSKGNRDGSRNGTYFINARNLEAFKKFEMVPLSLHEGNPGHHFDLTVFRHAFDFPGFLHTAGYGHYATFPAGTPIYTAFQARWENVSQLVLLPSQLLLLLLFQLLTSCCCCWW